MPRYANVRTTALRRLLLRMGFVETARNDHWRYRHTGLRLRVHVSILLATTKFEPTEWARSSPNNCK